MLSFTRFQSTIYLSANYKFDAPLDSNEEGQLEYRSRSNNRRTNVRHISRRKWKSKRWWPTLLEHHQSSSGTAQLKKQLVQLKCQYEESSYWKEGIYYAPDWRSNQTWIPQVLQFGVYQTSKPCHSRWREKGVDKNLVHCRTCHQVTEFKNKNKII